MMMLNGDMLQDVSWHSLLVERSSPWTTTGKNLPLVTSYIYVVPTRPLFEAIDVVLKY